jgi:hypothetical protein
VTDQPDPVNDALRLRASDADREKVAGLLRDAFAEGRISPVEHEERLAEVYRAATYAELLPVLQDLPLPPGSFTVPGAGQVVAVSHGAGVDRRGDEQLAMIDPSRADAGKGSAVAVMSETKRLGRWVVAPESTAVAFMGAVELDLSQAVLTSMTTEIQAFALMGAIRITVPDGVVVQSSVVAIMGACSEPPDDPPTGAPIVKVSGVAFMGEVSVKRTDRRWTS